MSFDFPDFFADALREIEPNASRRGVSLVFDCCGQAANIPGTSTDMLSSMHRLLRAMVDSLDVDLIVFDARFSLLSGGFGVIEARAAGSGRTVSRQTVTKIIRRLKLKETRLLSGRNEQESRSATGQCPDTGARIEFVHHPSLGVLIDVHYEVIDASARELGGFATGDSARSRLVDNNSISADTLDQRLQRLRLSANAFASPARALASLREWQVIDTFAVLADSPSFSLWQLRGQPGLIADWTHCIWTVLAGAAALDENEALARPRVDALPVSRDLADLVGEKQRPESVPQFSLTLPAYRLTDRPRLLVVDDEAVNRIVASSIAQYLGYDVSCANDGVEAIEECLREEPAVILMDIHMPRMGGVVATRAIRALQNTRSMYPCCILATTSADDARLRETCSAAGMDGYLLKPLATGSLRAELRRVCAKVNSTN